MYRQTQNFNATQQSTYCTFLYSINILCLTVHLICISVIREK